MSRKIHDPKATSAQADKMAVSIKTMASEMEEIIRGIYERGEENEVDASLAAAGMVLVGAAHNCLDVIAAVKREADRQ